MVILIPQKAAKKIKREPVAMASMIFLSLQGKKTYWGFKNMGFRKYKKKSTV